MSLESARVQGAIQERELDVRILLNKDSAVL